MALPTTNGAQIVFQSVIRPVFARFFSTAGPTVVVPVGAIDLPRRIVPEDAGLPRHPLAALHGGDPAYNAAALRRLLAGEHGAYRDAVLLNAAVALSLVGEALPAGAARAAEALDSGAANTLLDRWIAWP